MSEHFGKLTLNETLLRAIKPQWKKDKQLCRKLIAENKRLQQQTTSFETLEESKAYAIENKVNHFLGRSESFLAGCPIKSKDLQK